MVSRCRSVHGLIQPELIFDWNSRRMEAEMRYYAGANMNLIYFEDIPNPPEPFLEMCDRYGILFGHCAYSCYWLRPDTPYPDDFALLAQCTVDMIKRYRNHPSLLFYMAMNEEYTTYLKPMVSWFYAKKACEPLHVQLNLVDRTVAVINLHSAPQPDLLVRARIFDLDSRLLWDESAKTHAPADGYRDCFVIPEPPSATPVYFAKLELHDPQARLISENFYWLRASGVEDLVALQSLPPVKLESALTLEQHGDAQVARVRVSNPGNQIAFFIQVALTSGEGGPEILPVLWDDNYFSLLPGESREVAARFETEDVGGATPVLEVGGWNIESAFHCESLTTTTPHPKAGETVTVTASIRNTFLDGSRVWIRVNGAPTGAQWVWHRDGNPVEVEFPLKLNRTGVHEIEVGTRALPLEVCP